MAALALSPCLSTSPNVRHLRPWSHHRVALLTPERLREGHRIRHRAVHAPLVRRMRIRGHARAQRLVALVAAKALREADEKSLLRRVALDQPGASIALERALQRVVAGEHPTIVRDVLTLRECTVHVEGVHLNVAVVL